MGIAKYFSLDKSDTFTISRNCCSHWDSGEMINYNINPKFSYNFILIKEKQFYSYSRIITFSMNHQKIVIHVKVWN